MNCPTCKVELKMADRQGVEIDYCPQCRGVWLDRGELDKIVERSAQTGARCAKRRKHTGETNTVNPTLAKRISRFSAKCSTSTNPKADIR